MLASNHWPLGLTLQYSLPVDLVAIVAANSNAASSTLILPDFN
jgi:hypothetical protein